MKFASRVEVCVHVGDAVKTRFYAHAEHAKRMVDNGQVEKPKGQFIDKLFLVQPAVTEDRDEFRSSNSMIPGYMEGLAGGHVVRIDTPNRPTRIVETLGCRTYKLKRIRADVRSLYITAITDCLVSRTA